MDGWVEERSLETSSFLTTSSGERLAMKTSASSSRMMAFHSVAISKTFLTFLPSSEALVPSSSAWR